MPAGVDELVRRFYAEAWNAWSDAAVDELLADDFAFRGSLGDEERGPAGFLAYRGRVRAAFPDFRNEVIELVAAADSAAVRLRCSGRHDGAVLGIAPTGRRVVYDAAAFFRAGDGRLLSAWVLGDLDALRAQLAHDR
jgi:predicted ester cyclase